MNPFIQEVLHSIGIAPSSFLADFACAQMLRIHKPARYGLILTLLHTVPQLIFGALAAAGVSNTTTYNTICQLLIYVTVPLIFSHDRIGRTLFASALCLITLMLASSVAELVYIALGGEIVSTVAISQSNPQAYVIMFLTCFVLAAVMLPIMVSVWNRVLRRTNDSTFWYFLMFPVTQVILWSIAIRYTSLDRFVPARHIPIVAATLLCAVADILLLRAMQVYSRRAVSEEREKWYEQLLDQQQSYYTHIIADLEGASKIRHDIRNQLQTAYSLLDSGNPDAARAQLDGIRAAVNQSVQYCANPVVNALLSVKAERFAEAGIPLTCRCDVPQELPIPGVELCSLFSNVLDNAYNAASRCVDAGQGVTITSGIQGDVFTLHCQNPCSDEANEPRATGWDLRFCAIWPNGTAVRWMFSAKTAPSPSACS